MIVKWWYSATAGNDIEMLSRQAGFSFCRHVARQRSGRGGGEIPRRIEQPKRRAGYYRQRIKTMSRRSTLSGCLSMPDNRKLIRRSRSLRLFVPPVRLSFKKTSISSSQRIPFARLNRLNSPLPPLNRVFTYFNANGKISICSIPIAAETVPLLISLEKSVRIAPVRHSPAQCQKRIYANPAVIHKYMG